jgi:hypothetical protein
MTFPGRWLLRPNRAPDQLTSTRYGDPAFSAIQVPGENPAATHRTPGVLLDAKAQQLAPLVSIVGSTGIGSGFTRPLGSDDAGKSPDAWRVRRVPGHLAAPPLQASKSAPRSADQDLARQAFTEY